MPTRDPHSLFSFRRNPFRFSLPTLTFALWLTAGVAFAAPTLKELTDPFSRHYNLPKAIAVFNQNLKNPEVLLQAAVCYLSCNGLASNDQQAFLMLQKAAPRSPDAQALLAYLQHTGRGTTQNRAEALRNLSESLSRKSALAPALSYLISQLPGDLVTTQAQKSPQAQYLLGVFYARQIAPSSPTFLKNAQRHFTNAFEAGSGHARLALASLLYVNRQDQAAINLLNPIRNTPEGQSMQLLYRAIALRDEAKQLPYLKKLQQVYQKHPTVNTYRNVASLKMRLANPKQKQDGVNMFSALNRASVPDCDPLYKSLLYTLAPQNGAVSHYQKDLQEKVKTDPLTVQIFQPQVCPFDW